MTGLRPDSIGIYDLGRSFRLAAPDAVTLPQTFRNNGYHTAALGKILHTGHGNHEDADSWTEKPWKPTGAQCALKESTPESRKECYGERGFSTESADVPDNFYSDGKIADEAIARLKAADGKPFFLAVGFMKPHLPFIAPKKYWDLYDAEKLPTPEATAVPKGAPSYAPQFGGELHKYGDIPSGKVIPQELQRHLIHGYYAATSYVDAQIGRVLDGLNESGLAENMIVVPWGDHGWHLGDHGMWCKHTNYEQAARIPLLIAKPGAKPGSGVKTKAFAETVDTFPTLCAMASLPAPTGTNGMDLNDPTASPRNHIMHVYPRGNKLGRAIRTARYRLVEWKEPGAEPETTELELYDYKEGPLETKNISATNLETVAGLLPILKTYPEAKPQFRAKGKAPEKTKVDRTSLFNRRDEFKR